MRRGRNYIRTGAQSGFLLGEPDSVMSAKDS